ncbi:MAG: FtsX-like permease family protein [Planctomycetes bacterium]|nr:FtsX-like permease family protein [Planctomycetota bacterium]
MLRLYWLLTGRSLARALVHGAAVTFTFWLRAWRWFLLKLRMKKAGADPGELIRKMPASFFNYPLRCFLSILAIALGVALFVSGDLAGKTLIDSFAKSVQSISSKADFSVSYNAAGIELAEYFKLVDAKDKLGIEALAPFMERNARVIIRGQGEGSHAENVHLIHIMGIDPSRDASVRNYGSDPEKSLVLDYPEGVDESWRNFVSDENMLRQMTEENLALLKLGLSMGGSMIPAGAPLRRFIEGDVGALPAMFRPLIVTDDFLAQHDLQLGDEIEINTGKGRMNFRISGKVTLEGASRAVSKDIAFMPIMFAQFAFNSLGRIDRVDVVLKEDSKREEVQKSIRELLSPGVSFATNDEAIDDFQKAVAGFRNILVVSSLVTLLVGMFFIANTISMSVVERTRETGILRSLGATRSQIVWMFVGEGTTIGIIGSILGVPAGILMARGTGWFLMQSVEMLFVTYETESTTLDPTTLTLGLVLGVAMAFLASLLPALQAARTNPLDVLRASSYKAAMRGTYYPAFILGLALIAGSLYLWHSPIFGYYSGHAFIFASTIAFAMIAPQLTSWFCEIAKKLSSWFFFLTPRLAAENLMHHPLRTAMTVVVMALSFNLVIAVGVMSDSLKQSMSDWMTVTFPGDIAITTSDKVTNIGRFNPIDESFKDELLSVEGVDHVVGLRFPKTTYKGQTLLLGCFDMDEYVKTAFANVTESDFVDLPVKSRDDFRPLIERLKDVNRPSLIASENFEVLHEKGLGDFVTLDTLSGPVDFEIVAMQLDYSWPKGFLEFERAVYKHYFKDNLCDVFDVGVKKGENIDAVTARIFDKVADKYSLTIMPQSRYQLTLLAAIDEMYRMSYVQAVLALFIGLFGIVVTITISVITRTRELGLLRAVGMQRKQLMKMVFFESLFLSITGGIIGIVSGQLSIIPINMLFMSEVGFTIAYTFPGPTVAVVAVLSVLCGVGAALIPAWRASQLKITEAISYE